MDKEMGQDKTDGPQNLVEALVAQYDDLLLISNSVANFRHYSCF